MIDLLVNALLRYAKRTPYSHLQGYMNRNWLLPPAPGRKWAVRMHETLRSDHSRALHDHPWGNWSFVLRNGYWEITPGAYQQAVEAGALERPGVDPLLAEIHRVIDVAQGQDVSAEARHQYKKAGVTWRGRFAFVRRPAHALHRLVIPRGTTAVSIFGMAPKHRDWGYATPGGWVHNVDYDSSIREVAEAQAASRQARELLAVTDAARLAS